MRRFALAAFFVLFPLVAFAESVDSYIVVTRHPFRQAIVAIGDDALPGRAGRFISGFESVNGFEATLSDSEVAALRTSPEVRWIEPVLERHALGRIGALSDAVSSGAQTTPYGVTMVNAPGVWPVTKGKSLDPSKPTRVAIIDTGITYDDPELAAAYKGGHNFITGSDDPRDDAGHGTHVAGTIAAADNGAGVIGIAPEVEIYSLKMLSACGSGISSDVIHALDWILAKKAAIGGNWIVNLSLGSQDPSPAEQNAFQNAIAAGVLVFAASGNGYDTNPVDGLSYPAGYPGVVSVGAIDATQTVADFSQRGAGLKVVGPGVSVLSTVVAEKVATTTGDEYLANVAVAKDLSGGDLCLPVPTVSGAIVDSAKGRIGDFPASVSGKIALIERGEITFAEKAKNAKAAGAIGVICYNNDDSSDLIIPSLGNISCERGGAVRLHRPRRRPGAEGDARRRRVDVVRQAHVRKLQRHVDGDAARGGRRGAGVVGRADGDERPDRECDPTDGARPRRHRLRYGLRQRPRRRARGRETAQSGGVPDEIQRPLPRPARTLIRKRLPAARVLSAEA